MIQKKLFCIFLILSFIPGKSQHNVILEALDAPSDPQFTIVGCATALGYLAQGLPANSLDIAAGQQIQVNVIAPGPYNFTTNTANGVSFSASGTFTGTGLQTVTLIASGTPINYSINDNINVYLYSAVNTTGTNAGSCAFFRKTYLPDQNYTGTIRNDGQHRFLYKVITGPGNKQWLQTNLGAHYNQVGHPSFNPEMSATGVDDYLAFGSLFQVGRNSDGHELVNWTSAVTATGLSSTSTPSPAQSTMGNTGLFYTLTSAVLQPQSYYANVSRVLENRIIAGPGMPCPNGFITTDNRSYDDYPPSSYNAGGAYWISNPLKLVAPKVYRNAANGNLVSYNRRLIRTASTGIFPSTTGASAQFVIEGGDLGNPQHFDRRYIESSQDPRGNLDGYPVRCVKP